VSHPTQECQDLQDCIKILIQTGKINAQSFFMTTRKFREAVQQTLAQSQTESVISDLEWPMLKVKSSASSHVHISVERSQEGKFQQQILDSTFEQSQKDKPQMINNELNVRQPERQVQKIKGSKPAPMQNRKLSLRKKALNQVSEKPER
jgi:hypothetical protein